MLLPAPMENYRESFACSGDETCSLPVQICASFIFSSRQIVYSNLSYHSWNVFAFSCSSTKPGAAWSPLLIKFCIKSCFLDDAKFGISSRGIETIIKLRASLADDSFHQKFLLIKIQCCMDYRYLLVARYKQITTLQSINSQQYV